MNTPIDSILFRRKTFSSAWQLRRAKLTAGWALAFAVAGWMGMSSAVERQALLKVDLSCEKVWSPCVVGPEKAAPYPTVPRTVSIWMRPEVCNTVKPYIYIKDAQGEIYQALYLMGLGDLAPDGEARKVKISEWEWAQVDDNAVAVNGKVDPPVTLLGIGLPCRSPTAATLWIGPVAFDDTVVEDFTRDNNWHVLETGPGTKVQLARASPRVAAKPGHPNSWKFPERRDNLIPSGNFENGTGTPAGWHHGEEGHIALGDEDGKPAHAIGAHNATYRWADQGVQSFRSVSAEITKAKCWGGWDYTLHGIRSNTDYTISFWYKEPRPGVLRVYIFGQEVLMPNMYTDNPGHWIRYSGHFNSGDISGETDIGFYAECIGEPVKIWLDEVELYEGYSPIGYNLCRMQYYYHNFVNISPDMLSPAGFAFEHLFEDAQRPEEIDYVLELPEGVKLAGWRAAYFTWIPDHSRLTQEEVKVDGKPYTRHVITLKIRTDDKCRNFVVSVARRDRWGGFEVGDYCGMKQIHVWLVSTLKEGETQMRYYARWKGGAQAPQILALKTIRVPEVKPFKRFSCWGSTDGEDLTVCPELLRGFTRAGINCVRSSGGYGDGADHLLSSTVKLASQWENVALMRKAGIRDISTGISSPNHAGLFMTVKGDEPEAHGTGPDGQRGKELSVRPSSDWLNPGICLSYRSKAWNEWTTKTEKALADGVNAFMFDDYGNGNCYCPKCKDLFKEFLAKHTQLPYKDPAEFMKKPGSEAEYESLWRDFAHYHYGLTALELKINLEAHAKAQGGKQKVVFVESAGPVETDHAFAMEPVTKAFDIYCGQYYIHCYHGAYQGSPKRIGDAIAQDGAKLSKYNFPLCPLLEPGYVNMHPACMMDPYVVMKYQILEMALGASINGYAVYVSNDIDLGILANMAAANKILSEYEDIIMDGEVITEGVTGQGPLRSVRAKKLGKRWLILVADYSTYEPKTAEVHFKLPAALELKDVESGVMVKPEADGAYRVLLKGARQRIFYAE